ncbi:MAG: hypothetical protein PHQ62_03575 [Clostridia bacterium]|nr:hypothetical protein [Clostridia bacterium]
MLKFSKIFLLSFMIILGSCCALFLTAEKTIPIQILEAEESIEYETEPSLGYDCFLAENGSSSNSQTTFYTNYYTENTVVFETVLVNFNDWAVFNQSTYQTYFDKLAEVSRYFDIVSRGNLQVFFNVSVCTLNESISNYINQEIRYLNESLLFDKCLANSFSIGDDYGTAQIRFLMFSSTNNFMINTSMFWPHAYPTASFMVMNSGTPSAVICHELHHTLGLLDLYVDDTNNTQKNFQPVANTDIMATGYTLTTPTSAYNRYLLSWILESSYNDGVETAIESINVSNSYLINEAMQTSGTIAYKFGTNGNEFFLIECRKIKETNYLIIQRINTSKNQNLNAQDQSMCYIYSFPSKSNSLYFGKGDSLGTASGELYYSNGISANFSLCNIVDLGNNQVQFDFFINTNNSMQKTVNVFDKSTSQPITNATIKVNGTITSSNTITFKEGDTIEVIHENYKTIKIIASGENINFASGNIIVYMTDKNETFLGDTFQLDLILDGVQDFVLNNNISVFINNILMQFHNTITLKNGDILKIASGNNQTYNSTYLNGTLSDNSGNTVIINNTIQITLNPATCNYYLNVRDSNNVFVNITSLYLFNNFTKEWDFFNDISIVYVNGLKVYALNNVPFYYTQVKVNYASFNTTTSQMAYINVGNNFYNIQLNKNIIQNTGDFIFGIANNIKNWFA